MKKLRITLNEKVYEVSVEVLEDDESHYPGANLSPTESIYPKPPVLEHVTPSPISKPSRPTGPTSGNQVLAPIVGTVNRILVNMGDSVKENQPLIVLDAMKMDTYINATRSGIIQSIDCKTGDNVHVGQKLITIS